MTGLLSDSQVLMVPPLHRSYQSVKYYKDGDAPHFNEFRNRKEGNGRKSMAALS